LDPPSSPMYPGPSVCPPKVLILPIISFSLIFFCNKLACSKCRKVTKPDFRRKIRFLRSYPSPKTCQWVRFWPYIWLVFGNGYVVTTCIWRVNGCFGLGCIFEYILTWLRIYTFWYTEVKFFRNRFFGPSLWSFKFTSVCLSACFLKSSHTSYHRIS